MEQILKMLTLSVLLSLFCSCNTKDQKDLDLQKQFFKEQSRDPDLIGTWKSDSFDFGYGDIVVYQKDGSYKKLIGATHYLSFYTKDGYIYYLTTGRHSNNPYTEQVKYRVEGNTLYIDYGGTRLVSSFSRL